MSDEEKAQIIGGMWVKYGKACQEKAFVEERINVLRGVVQKWGRWLEGMGMGACPEEGLPSEGEIKEWVRRGEEQGDIVRDLRQRMEVLGCL